MGVGVLYMLPAAFGMNSSPQEPVRSGALSRRHLTSDVTKVLLELSEQTEL